MAPANPKISRLKEKVISISEQAKKESDMRKTTKVARVSCYCKLNMLVPHLKTLSARMQAETPGDKARAGYNVK